MHRLQNWAPNRFFYKDDIYKCDENEIGERKRERERERRAAEIFRIFTFSAFGKFVFCTGSIIFWTKESVRMIVTQIPFGEWTSTLARFMYTWVYEVIFIRFLL